MIQKLLLASAVFLLYATNSYAQVAVIVNKSVPASSVNASKLLDIYSMSNKDWGNGSKIVVIDKKSDDDTKSKFYSYIGKPAAEMKKIWMRVQLSGEGKAPEALATDDDIVKKVASTPGAIGYVSADKVTGDVKVVATIK